MLQVHWKALLGAGEIIIINVIIRIEGIEFEEVFMQDQLGVVTPVIVI